MSGIALYLCYLYFCIPYAAMRQLGAQEGYPSTRSSELVAVVHLEVGDLFCTCAHSECIRVISATCVTVPHSPGFGVGLD